MKNSTSKSRAIGLLVVFASVLALMAIWNLPQTEDPLRLGLN
jgi:hypothetical protein